MIAPKVAFCSAASLSLLIFIHGVDANHSRPGWWASARHARDPAEHIHQSVLRWRLTPSSFLMLGCISSFIGPYLTHVQPTRPISKVEALKQEIGSTFCSRGPVRQSAYLP